ncbi:hypothetical protein [Bradyrhizobium sp. 151]|uniref:hypothetical protein n=1 Tax=Bradyrhizobium sp. 151 TaxID=2782626 RepID=UPI001FFBBE54|nr:hypothetical protein [Bradyrhizobium sp. 151]MCK1656615.1 hypothetical protein [Bradyrhizobium sp. 151]
MRRSKSIETLLPILYLKGIRQTRGGSQQYRSRVLANLQRRAKAPGFVLQAIPGEDAHPAVS